MEISILPAKLSMTFPSEEKILAKLVTYKTETIKYAEVKAAFEYIEKLARQIPGAKLRYFQNKGVRSLLISLGNWRRPKVLMAGHIDVVPPPSVDYFVPKLSRGKMFGRGVIDMKGGIAAMLGALAAVATERKRVTDISVLITSDEEIGGANGTGYVLSTGDTIPEFAIVADGPQLDTMAFIVKEKGGLWIEVRARGKNAHAARPWLGENAIYKVLEAVGSIKKIVGRERPDAWASTMNVARIETSNTAINMVPAEASALIDIRFTESLARTPEDLLKLLQKKVRGVDIALRNAVPMFYTSPAHPEIKAMRRSFRRIIGKETPLRYGHGASDARYFAAYGIPAVLVGPVGANWHGPNEWVDLKSIVLLKESLVEYLRNGSSFRED